MEIWGGYSNLKIDIFFLEPQNTSENRCCKSNWNLGGISNIFTCLEKCANLWLALNMFNLFCLNVQILDLCMIHRCERLKAATVSVSPPGLGILGHQNHRGTHQGSLEAVPGQGLWHRTTRGAQGKWDRLLGWTCETGNLGFIQHGTPKFGI